MSLLALQAVDAINKATTDIQYWYANACSASPKCTFNKTKSYFPGNTYDEAKSERTIGSAFDGAYNHGKNRSENIKTQALYSNPHNRQFPICRGTDDADVDDGSTGELEGVYGKMLVLLSRFSQLPTKSILQDMLNEVGS